MYYRDFNEHKKSDKAKWIVSFVLIFLLMVAVFALLVSVNPFCMFGHEFESGVCSTCGEICSHEKVNEDNTCKKCGEIVEGSSNIVDEIDTTPDVVNADGEALFSNTAYSFTNLTFARTTAMSSVAYEGITLTAKIEPSYATNQKVDWLVSWVNPNSEWATDKVVTDYVKVTPNGDGALSAVVTCLAPFAEQIKVEVISRDNVDIKSSATIDYRQRVKNVTVSIGDIVLTEGNNSVPFEISSGITGKGGNVKLNVEFTDVYTVASKYADLTQWGLNLPFDDGNNPDQFTWITGTDTNGDTWSSNTDVFANALLSSTSCVCPDYITFDIDFLNTTLQSNGYVMNRVSDGAFHDLNYSSFSQEDIISIIESAKANNTAGMLVIGVILPDNARMYFNINFGELTSSYVPVESVSVDTSEVLFNNDEE